MKIIFLIDGVLNCSSTPNRDFPYIVDRGKTDRDMRRNAIVRLVENVRAVLKSHKG